MELLSFLRFGRSWPYVLPIPNDGILDADDRATLLGLYSGISLPETTGGYSIRSDVECIYGVTNVSKWADLDNDGNISAISGRISDAIHQADAIIDAYLLEGPYEIPFTKPYDEVVVDMSARLAGVLLYEGRGITDSDISRHQLIWHRENVFNTLKNILLRRCVLSNSLVTQTIQVPSTGSTHYLQLQTTDATQPSAYSTRTNIEDIYGVTNISKWADLDNDGDVTKITNRITKIIDKADAYINCKLRKGPYSIPFVVSPYDGIVVDMSARLAGVMLYECRGITDSETSRHELIWHKERVDKIIRNILKRNIYLSYSKTLLRTSVMSASGDSIVPENETDDTQSTAYSTRSNVESIYGRTNVTKWADLDNDGDVTKITNRISRMITKADDYINGVLRAGPYDIPFQQPYSQVIIDMSARLAGVLLYECRGITDGDSSKHQLIWHLEQVDKQLRYLIKSQMRLKRSIVTSRKSQISVGYDST